MSNISNRTIVRTVDVRGRAFEVERITWRDSVGLSFDVRDVATGLPLHNESFDDEPSVQDIEDMLDSLADDRATGQLDSIFADEAENLIAVLGPVGGR